MEAQLGVFNNLNEDKISRIYLPFLLFNVQAVAVRLQQPDMQAYTRWRELTQQG